MNGRGVSRSAVLLLLGLGLLAGLFAMHGVTAAPSPAHASTPVVATGHHAAAPAMPGGHESSHPAIAPMDSAGHIGGCALGTICFALLTGMLLLVLAVARAVELLPARAGRARGPILRRGPPRARPPTVYQLSVLRL